MLIALLSKWSCHVCSYLYPAYASYKALSHHPDSSPEAMAQVERWLMYWAVVGTWTAVESVLGWTFTWLPFYSLIKTLIFLYLSLPQSEGSSYIYNNHLAPFFHEHESDIDAFLASLRSRASTALAGGVGWCWEKVKAQLNIALPAGHEPFPNQGGYHVGDVQGFDVPGLHQPPTLQDPASGAIQQVYGLVTRYAGHYMPVALSALTAAAASAQSSASVRPRERAEQVPESMSMPIPVPTPGVRSAPSDNTLRSRTYLHASGGGASISSPELAQASARFQGHRPSASSSNSEDSLFNSGANSKNSSHVRLSSDYEQINRDEAMGAPGGQRPGIGDQRRSSGWFGWGGTPEKPKSE
ncbi:hypothetical protein I302_108761 [Kwoniella bestiolae CBS 10118]|uniref:Protein YOP1 n=1 Tax=Kwoniella bestiolae CBS 10118 TaxID=1296100 RepID=A0A1B9FU11_9TREE|nr:hypothetical protein I302_07898 [Kwoniella bestiolae CBS 10118]OCF22253.1 hypothetical protein I302_07898 [Kwoniella bestiolae CBS 10118]